MFSLFCLLPVMHLHYSLSLFNASAFTGAESGALRLCNRTSH